MIRLRQPRLASCNYSFGKRRERYRGFESSSLRHAVSGLRHSPGMIAKSARVGAMRPLHRHRRELTCEAVLRYFGFLSMCEEFGADAERTARGANLRIIGMSRTVRRASPSVSDGKLPLIPRHQPRNGTSVRATEYRERSSANAIRAGSRCAG